MPFPRHNMVDASRNVVDAGVNPTTRSLCRDNPCGYPHTLKTCREKACLFLVTMWLTRASTLQERTKLDGIDFKNVITAAELVRLQWRPHGWLLWQIVPQGGITLLAGETAAGKSFLGLDLALGVASARGKAWDMELGESQESAKPPILSDTDTLPRFTDPPSMYRLDRRVTLVRRHR